MAIDPVEDPYSLVVDALSEEPGWSLVSRTGSGALLRSADGRAVAIVPLDRADGSSVDRDGASGARLEVLAFGAERGAAVAFFPPEPTEVGWIHLGADGRLVTRAADDEPLWVAAWLNRRPDVEEALRRHARRARLHHFSRGPAAAPSEASAPDDPPPAAPPVRRAPSGLRAFWDSGEPLVTWAVIVISVVMFGLQVYLGSLEDSSVLFQLGALPGTPLSLVMPWLLVSYGYLHGDIAHLGFNMVAIWSMGMWLERVLGRARFWLLYLGSVIGGGLMIVAFGSGGLTVGASGGAWGLMTGSLVLVWMAPQIVGYGAREVLGPMIGRNLVLNLILSMLPGVSLAGHLGGGLAGAAITGVFVLLARSGRRAGASALPTSIMVLASLGVVLSFAAQIAAVVAGPALVRMLEGG